MRKLQVAAWATAAVLAVSAAIPASQFFMKDLRISRYSKSKLNILEHYKDRLGKGQATETDRAVCLVTEKALRDFERIAPNSSSFVTRQWGRDIANHLLTDPCPMPLPPQQKVQQAAKARA